MKGGHAYFAGAGKVRLHYRCWNVTDPRAAVIVAHGLGEHSGRYEPLAQDLARAGLSTYALDHRGHGRSDGQRGHVRRFTQYVQDLERFRRRVVGAVGRETPLILLGHSLGGLIAARYVEEFPGVELRGVVLSAPLLGLAVEVPDWREKLARALLYLAPALPLAGAVEPELLSHDPEVVEAYRVDPLVHDRVTPRLYQEIKTAIRAARARAQRIQVPVLFLIPGSDRLVRAEAVQAFAGQVSQYAPVTTHVYPDLYHEPLNETTRSSTVADVLGWIERRIAGPIATEGRD